MYFVSHRVFVRSLTTSHLLCDVPANTLLCWIIREFLVIVKWTVQLDRKRVVCGKKETTFVANGSGIFVELYLQQSEKLRWLTSLVRAYWMGTELSRSQRCSFYWLPSMKPISTQQVLLKTKPLFDSLLRNHVWNQKYFLYPMVRALSFIVVGPLFHSCCSKAPVATGTQHQARWLK